MANEMRHQNKHTVTTRSSPLKSLALWAVGPLLLTILVLLAPHLSARESFLAPITFAGGVALLSGTFWAIALSRTSPSVHKSVAISSLIIVVAVAISRTQASAAVVLVDSSLLLGAFAVGHLLGARVEHAGHMLPAAFVVSGVDIVSVVHPQGPSHFVAQSERLLDVLTLSFPIVGTSVVAPTIGVGDMLMIALMLGVAQRFSLPVGRVVLASGAGLVFAGWASSFFRQAVPALPFVSACVVLAVPSFRRLRPSDKRGAFIAACLSVATAVGVVLWRFQSLRGVGG